MIDSPVNAYNLQFSLSSFPCGRHFSFTAAFRLSCICKISGTCIIFIKLYSNLYGIGTNGTRTINICFIRLYSKLRKKETARTVSFFTYKICQSIYFITYYSFYSASVLAVVSASAASSLLSSEAAVASSVVLSSEAAVASSAVLSSEAAAVSSSVLSASVDVASV